MIRKPKHLGRPYADAFQDQSVYSVYRYRPPYPEQAIQTLLSLVAGTPRRVLDVGSGTGDLARRLAPLVDRVDAVDVSARMIGEGRKLPNGRHPALRWIQGQVEDVELDPLYALITAGESLHWMKWNVVLPRFAEVLTPEGVLAVAGREWLTERLRERLHPLFRRYSINRDYRPIELAEELARRGLFRKLGDERAAPVRWDPTVDEYMACTFSQSGFSRDRMGADAAAFDAAMREALAEFVEEGLIACREGRLALKVGAVLFWGKPCHSTDGNTPVRTKEADDGKW